MLTQLVDRLTTTPLIGVDIGSAAIKVAELARIQGRVMLRRCGVSRLDGRDPSTALRRLLSEANVTTAQAAVALGSPQLIVKPFMFPAMPKKELRNAIKLEAEQAILNGHAIREMAVDWHTLGTPSSKSGIRGVVSVVPKKLVAERLKPVKDAGLRPLVADVEGLALWNAYWTLIGSQEASPKTVLLMNIGAATTNVVVARGADELVLVRDLQLGGTALAGGQEQDWLAEVRDSLGYARSQGGLRLLDAVYATGGGSSPSIIPLVKSVVSAPLMFWNPLAGVARDLHSPPVDESIGPLLAVAIGLALRQPS
jgi:Tfp pilus assembly PilM family ATPase